MPATNPRVFNIPASASFLPTLTAALRRGELVPGFPASNDPLELARAKLYLPTRRACRLARDTFAATLDGQAILPRIIALGDLDEDPQKRRRGGEIENTWFGGWHRGE